MTPFVNRFYVIAVRDEPSAASDIDRMFGLPCGIAADRWPREDGTKLHHLLTLRVKGLDLPLPDEVSAVSIFLRPPGAGPGQSAPPFLVVRSTSADMEQGCMAGYPSGYEPWWDDGHPFALSIREGLSVELQEQEIPKEIVEGMVLKRDVLPDYAAINAFANEQSYVGGFPVWTQEDETPLGTNGARTHFVLSLNGYSKYLELSPIGGQITYLFMDDAGSPYWVSQG